MTTWMGIPIGGDYPLDEEKEIISGLDFDAKMELHGGMGAEVYTAKDITDTDESPFSSLRAEVERLELALWETQAVADGLLEHATVKQLRARVAELEGALRDIVKWGMDEQMTIIARAALEGKP